VNRMTKYAKFEQNSEIIDVLSCVILGKDSVKEMTEVLKQPQPKISHKLRFLRNNSIVIKNGWKYKPKWSNITKVCKREIQRFFDFYLIPPSVLNPSKKKTKESKRMIKDFMEFFDGEKIKSIMTCYSSYLINEVWFEKKSISDIMMIYFDGLVQTDYEDLEKMNPILTKLKKMLGMSSMEKVLFLETEL